MVVVVVFPCVPATATFDLRRISSASISARRTIGMPSRRASLSSGFELLIAEDTTATSAPARCDASCPRKTFAPSLSRRAVMGVADRSDPCTWYPWFSSTSAMPDMPIPPIPMKWTGPSLNGILVGGFMSANPLRPARQPASPASAPHPAGLCPWPPPPSGSRAREP